MMTQKTVRPNPEHPAKYSPEILAQLRAIVRAEAARLGRRPTLLDQHAGVGRIHELFDIAETIGVELEPEWAACNPRTIVGDACHLLDEWASWFDIIATSPVYPNRMCLAQDERLLTADLHWVAAGDIEDGERLLTFDDFGTGYKINGAALRRKWRVGRVMHSEPMQAECVRVTMSNGDSIVCTVDHPWLARRARAAATWVQAKDLLRYSDRPANVLKQVEPWQQRRSYEAGWMAGMFDGEGSLSFGMHGTPKLIISQAEGDTATLIGDRLSSLGYDWTAYEHKREGRRSVLDFHITGGFHEILRVLGEVRPERLISKLNGLEFESRSIQPWAVEVVAVEPVGVRTIQSIETSTGTYIGEGYLMHNTDHHDARDKCSACRGERRVGGVRCTKCKGTGISPRKNYKTQLGRMPSIGSSAILGWGDAYRDFTKVMLGEADRVLDDGGLLVVNMSNHFKSIEQPDGSFYSVQQPVVEWYVDTIASMGYFIEAVLPVRTSRSRHGANYDLRAKVEQILVMRKPPAFDVTP